MSATIQRMVHVATHPITRGVAGTAAIAGGGVTAFFGGTWDTARIFQDEIGLPKSAEAAGNARNLYVATGALLAAGGISALIGHGRVGATIAGASLAGAAGTGFLANRAQVDASQTMIDEITDMVGPTAPIDEPDGYEA